MKTKSKIMAAVLSLAMLIPAVGCGKEAYTVLNYDLTEYVKVGTYKGIPVEVTSYEVRDEDIQQQVLLARTNYAEAAPKNGAAELSDQVNIDYTGYMDGKTFEGGTAQGYVLTLGSGSFIDGFEEGLVGAKAGDTVTLNISFPKSYPSAPELAGKPVQFVVTVNQVIGQKLPDYTDAFVKEKYGYDTIALFEAALRESLVKQYETSNEYARITQAWSAVLESSEVLQYPEEEFNGIIAEYKDYYTSLAQQDGISMNEYAQKTLEMSVKEFEEFLVAEAKDYLKQQMIIYHIVRTEGIEVTDEEYNTGALAYAQRYGLSSVAELEAYFSPEEITQNLLYDEVMEFVGEHTVVKQ